jgi:molybdopterin-guanine dinucleotide biosynthesis protein MobB
VTPIVSVVGRSGTGKTTLLEKLLRELRGRGRRVGTVKHHVHGRVEVDVPGKDSWRHRQAGASAVSLSSHGQLVLIRDVPAELPVPVIAHRLLFDVDLVLTEGFLAAATPKVEVSRAALGVPLLSGPGDGLVAVVADWDTGAPVPHFGLDDPGPLADFLQRQFPPAPAESAQLLLAGQPVTLDREAEVALSRALRTLLGADPGAAIELRLPAWSPIRP